MILYFNIYKEKKK